MMRLFLPAMLRTSKKPPARSKRRRLTVSKFAHDRALHYLARQQEYRLPAVVRIQLTEVVLGYTVRCDEDAARRGIEWMRERERAKGKTPMF